METESPDSLNPLDVRTYFVRGRNALVARADFGALYEDYYLHWMQHGIRFPGRADAVLKDALAALVLHLASRPQDETVAWTVNIPEPRISLFVTGASRPGQVVGRVWTDGVRVADTGLFCAEIQRGNGSQSRSNVDFPPGEFFRSVEAYYERSEQRPARLFRHGPEDIVLITAQPECDLDWLASLDDEAVRALDKQETLSLLETRRYVFDCGCTSDRIVARLAVIGGEDRDHLFDGGDTIRVDCPRCGAIFDLTRDMFDAHDRNTGQAEPN